jgi:hypothetical protein
MGNSALALSWNTTDGWIFSSFSPKQRYFAILDRYGDQGAQRALHPWGVMYGASTRAGDHPSVNQAGPIRA